MSTNELRESLREAPPVTGARLQAVYGAEDRGLLVDAENVLLYNVGSASWRHLASQGVSFERSFGYPSPPQDSGLPEKGLHYHRYGFVESKAFTHWRAGDLLASFVDVAVPSLAKPGPIWAAVRRQASPPAAAPANPIRFVVELTIGGAHPSLSRRLADQVKPALEGVISAFHTHRGETGVVSERLANSGVGERDELGQLLHDPAWNILGSRTVVRPFGATGVQWNPADDMCVAATVQPANVDPAATAPRWRLTGKIHKAEPK